MVTWQMRPTSTPNAAATSGPLGDRARRPSILGPPHIEADAGEQHEADDEIDDLPHSEQHRADVDEAARQQAG